MKSHYERCRDAAQSTAFKLSLSISAIKALRHYQTGSTAAVDCRRVRNASQRLYSQGLLNKRAKMDAAGRREFAITDVGQKVFDVLQAVGLLGEQDPPASSVNLKSHYKRFAAAVKGPAVSFYLPRSAIELLRAHVERVGHIANCRRHREAYENLLAFGCVSVAEALDEFDRETYTVTDIGDMFYALLVFADYIPDSAIATASATSRKKASSAVRRKR